MADTKTSDAKTKRNLTAELNDVLGRLARWDGPATSGPRAETATVAGDLIDDAQAVEATELGHINYGRLAMRAKSLSLALGRLRDGTYGICDGCGKRIPIARLRAVPEVTTCVACQEERERYRDR